MDSKDRIETTAAKRRSLFPLLVALALATGLAIAAHADKVDITRVATLDPVYKAWLDEVDSILTKEEREAFLKLEKDYQRDAFIERFWQARDPYPDTARNEMRETWEARVSEARAAFGKLTEDRARFFLLNGAPSARIPLQCAASTWPLEIWAYPRSERIHEDVMLFVFYRPFNQGPFKLWYPYEGIAQLMQFAQVVFAIGGGVETPARPQHAPDLGKRLWPIRHVVEHMVGDHRVEAGIGEWDRLRVGLLEREWMRAG